VSLSKRPGTAKKESGMESHSKRICEVAAC